MKWVKRKPYKRPKQVDNISEKLAKIRGVDNLEEFLNPPMSNMHSPYELDNIDEAVARIIKAIYKGEKIDIFADIDADGVFSFAHMYNYLAEMTDRENLNCVHSQRSKGHGLKTVMKPDDESKVVDGVRYLSDDADLLIIVDSSSNSVEECKYVSEEMGIDIVIIDHHLIEVDNPYATIVNCQMGDYKNKSLSGSAMVYKVCKAIDDYMGIDLADNFLDIASIGIIADMMSLAEKENRSIINKGLQNINNLGLKTLFSLLKVDTNEQVSATNVSFKISPLVNSCTRYDKIELALKLFTLDDEQEAFDVAKEMSKLNQKRKDEESGIVESALSKVDNNHSVAFLIDDEIDSGFRGLVAMQLVQKLNKPVFVLKHDKKSNSYSGSARTLGELPLKTLCEETNSFLWCQGHEGAFGLEVECDSLQDAIDKLSDMIDDEDLKDAKTVYYDLELSVDDITREDIEDIERFSLITGKGLPTPKFKVNDILVDSTQILGKNKDTVKIHCDKNFACMKFKTNESYTRDINLALNKDPLGVQISAVGTLNINRYFNYRSKELEITNQILMDDYKFQ